MNTKKKKKKKKKKTLKGSYYAFHFLYFSQVCSVYVWA